MTRIKRLVPTIAICSFLCIPAFAVNSFAQDGSDQFYAAGDDLRRKLDRREMDRTREHDRAVRERPRDMRDETSRPGDRRAHDNYDKRRGPRYDERRQDQPYDGRYDHRPGRHYDGGRHDWDDPGHRGPRGRERRS